MTLLEEDGTRQVDAARKPARQLLAFYFPAAVSAIGFLGYLSGAASFYQNGSLDLSFAFFPGVIVSLFVAPALGLAQATYGLIQFFRTRERDYLHHLFSFLVTLLFCGFTVALLSIGYFPTV